MSITADAPVTTALPAAASDSQAPARTWAWGFLLAFLVHDGEELVAIWSGGGSVFLGRTESPLQCAAGILAEGTLGWVLILLATRPQAPPWRIRAFSILLAGFALHGLAHLAAAAAVRGYAASYVFGAVTALPACVVYGAFALHRLRSSGLLDRRWLTIALVAGLPASLPLIPLAHAWGWLIA